MCPPNKWGQRNRIDQINQITAVKITRFEDLRCWQESRILTNKVYEITRNGAFKKDLRLSGQIQAAATSVMANIAEGFIRRSDKEFVQFLFIAMSSAAEVQSHLYVALDQGYVDREHFDKIYGQANKTAMLISGLVKYLRAKRPKTDELTEKIKQSKLSTTMKFAD